MQGETGWIDNRESFRVGAHGAVLQSLLYIGFWIVLFLIPAIWTGGDFPLSWIVGPVGILFWVVVLVLSTVGAMTGAFVPIVRRIRVFGDTLEVQRKGRKRSFALTAFPEVVFFEKSTSRALFLRTRVPSYVVYLIYPPFGGVSLGPIDSPLAELLMAEVARVGGRVKVFSMGTLVSNRPLGGGNPIPHS